MHTPYSIRITAGAPAVVAFRMTAQEVVELTAGAEARAGSAPPAQSQYQRGGEPQPLSALLGPVLERYGLTGTQPPVPAPAQAPRAPVAALVA